MLRTKKIDLQGSRESRLARGRGFSLIEVMVAIGLISISILPVIGTIQMSRVHARSVGFNMIGEKLAASIMELVKRSGFNEITYSSQLPAILDMGEVSSPLLDFPRTPAGGGGAEVAALPGGAPGDVSEESMLAFVAVAREGKPDSESPILTSNANYLSFSQQQIIAMNGYETLEDFQADNPEGAELLDPGYAWGVFIRDDPAGDPGGAIGFPLKHVVIIVKWVDGFRGRTDFTVLESYVSAVGPRL